MTENFESLVHKTESGVKFWLASNLLRLLGYAKWENFQNVVFKAKTACELSGQNIADHFPDVRKTIKMPKNVQKEITDIMLTTLRSLT